MARPRKNSSLEFWSQRQKVELGGDQSETLASGRYLLYHRPKNGAAGVWRARYYDPNTKKMQRTVIGVADDFLAANNIDVLDYKGACDRADRWFTECSQAALRSAGGEVPLTGPYTVADAMRDYLDALNKRGSRSASMSEITIKAHILPDLGAIELTKLTRKRVEDWHIALAAAGRRRTGRVRAEPDLMDAPKTADEKRARKDTANRILTTLKAGLNLALAEGRAQEPAVWRGVKPFKGVGSSRVRFLSAADQQSLVEACGGEFKDLVIGALACGARYGELSRCRVKDFHPKARTLFIEFGKNGKSRHIKLGSDAVVWFTKLAKGRGEDEALFKHSGVTRLSRTASDDWMPYDQRDRMEKACAASGVKVTFHELRHTYASALVNAGMPLIYVAAQLGHSDTRMVERYYGHLAPTALTEAVDTYSPKLGIFGGAPVKRLKTKSSA